MLPTAKTDWAGVLDRYEAWWERRGLLIGSWGCPPAAGESFAPGTPLPGDPEQRWSDPEVRARSAEEWLRQGAFPGDILPVCDSDLGPGSLATMLGSVPGWGHDTIWFDPAPGFADGADGPELRFDPGHPEVRRHVAILDACRRRLGDAYWVACPDLVEGLDVLASLRGAQPLMTDLIERPEWADEKLTEITTAWIAAYAHLQPWFEHDGCTCFGAFRACGRGRVAKVQCDASAMISPRMYRRFVVPHLERQCAWLDRSLYHLDGTQAMPHLDLLLAEAPSLDAIEWTPQVGIESGGDPRWHPLYRRIKAAGKSVQVFCEPGQVLPLLDAIGPEGTYLLVSFRSVHQHDETIAAVAAQFGDRAVTAAPVRSGAKLAGYSRSA